MFCVKCGGVAKAGVFCEKCFLGKEKLFTIDDFTLEVCESCGKVAQHRSANSLKEAIEQKIKSTNRITKCDISTKEVGSRVYTKILCEGYIKPLKTKVSQTEKSIVTMRKKKCDSCVKLSGGYYEAVLQVRGENQERVMKKIQKFVRNEDITSVIKLKEGYDVRLMHKGSAIKAVSWLRDFFTVKASYKLVGEKKGDKLYRNFYAVR